MIGRKRIRRAGGGAEGEEKSSYLQQRTLVT